MRIYLVAACIAYLAVCITIVRAHETSRPQTSDATPTNHCHSTRMITLGGNVTEIVYALGMGDSLVGTDISSRYPDRATQLPSVGYYRQLPVEGILRLRPEIILASEHAGPEHVLTQLQASGVRVIRVSDKPSIESLYERIEHLSQLLCKVEQGLLLQADLTHSLTIAEQHPVKPESVMLLVMRAGKLLGAASQTHAAKIIELSGLVNVLEDQSGYRQISPEILSARQPAGLIVTRLSVQSMGGLDAVLQHPAIRLTPAAQNARAIELDDQLVQGIGLRLPLAIQAIKSGLGTKNTGFGAHQSGTITQ